MDIGGEGDVSGEIGMFCSGEPGLSIPNMAVGSPAGLQWKRTSCRAWIDGVDG